MRFTRKSRTQKKKPPLFLAYARNSLPHKKASRFFVPQCFSGALLPFFGFQKLYTLYGKKPMNTPENFDSLASLTFMLRYPTLFKIFYPPSRVRADGESHPPARLLITLASSLSIICAAGFACAQAAAIYWNPVTACLHFGKKYRFP